MLTLPWLQSSKLYMARNQPCHPITPGIGTPPNQALTPHSRCLECTMGADANGGRGGLKPSTASSLACFMPASWLRRPPSLSLRESLHLFLVVSRDSLARSFVSPPSEYLLAFFLPSFLPRILICCRPSCSAATKEREGETETSVPFFLLSSDKKPQDRPRPNLFYTCIMFHIDLSNEN